MVQSARFLAALAGADPHYVGATHVREATGSLKGQVEGFVFLSGLVNGPAHGHQVPIVDFAEKKQSEVQVGWFDPLNVGPDARQTFLESNNSVLDRLAGINGD